MASASSLAGELENMARYLVARGGGSDDVADAMVSAYVKKIETTSHVDIGIGMAVVKALSTSCLPPVARARIQHAIDTKLSAGMTASVGASNIVQHHAPQKLTGSITNYLSHRDWHMLDDDKLSLQGKIQVVVDRFHRLCLFWPSEQTIKWMVALLVVQMCKHGSSFPSYSHIFGLVKDVKSVVDACRPKDTSTIAFHIGSYPDDPSNLPADLLKSAYDDDDGAAARVVERLSVTAEGHIPLRKSSVLLRNGSTSASSAGVSPAITMDDLRSLLSRGQLGLPDSPRTPPSILRMLPDRDRRYSPPAALEDLRPTPPHSPTVVAPVPVVGPACHGPSAPVARPEAGDRAGFVRPAEIVMAAPHGVAPLPAGPAHLAPAVAELLPPALAPHPPVGVPPRMSTEEFEVATFKALTEREKPKVALKKAGTVVPAKGMKRPAAAPALGLAPLAELIATKWSDADAHKGRRLFTSKLYHSRKKACEMLGMDEVTSKTEAKAALSAAGVYWDEWHL